MNRACRFHAACVCALAQWSLAVAIQIGNGAAWSRLPFLQTQNVVIAALLGLVAWVSADTVVTTWFFFALFCAESLGLVLDQAYYTAFLDHTRIGAFEGGRRINFAILSGSFVHELNAAFLFSCIVAFLGVLWFARAISRPGPGRVVFWWLPAALGVFAAMGIPALASRQDRHLNEHALLDLAHDLHQDSLPDVLKSAPHAEWNAAAATSSNTKPFQSDQPADVDARLAALGTAARSRRSPNILLIVLESVGAVNLLGPDRLPVREHTPALAALARDGIVFDSLYTTFPGTTRSLVTLHTGGRQLTYGSIDEFLSRYEGPALARSFGKHGYDTAYFSSERMDGEGSDLFLRQMDFARYYDFSQDPNSHRKNLQIHSWGAREDYTASLIENWIGSPDRADRPFFLEYMTAATHHPYGAPAGYPAPFSSDTSGGQFLNALHFTDHTIGEIVECLRARDLLRNTIVAVTGDHGESFGERHAQNLLHNGFIYDENVREFLVISDGRNTSPAMSARVGSSADIMPTLLDLAGLPPADVPGRSLFGERFEARPAYFYKQAPPESWGLRDGRWKYIGEIRSGEDELYDIDKDPTEQRNLAPVEAARVARYRAASESWFLNSERDFTARLKNYRGSNPEITQGNIRTGAMTLAIGYWDPSLKCTGSAAKGYLCQNGSFVERAQFLGNQPPVAVTKWSVDPDYSLQYEWTSPSGRKLLSHPAAGKEWHSTQSVLPGGFPVERGEWSVRLLDGSPGRLAARFTIK